MNMFTMRTIKRLLLAAVMLLVVYSGDVFHRESDPLNALCIAALALTGTRPYLIGSASFLLSAAGVFAVAVAAPWLTAHFPADTLPRRMLKALAGSALIPVLLMPVCACYFQWCNQASAAVAVGVLQRLSQRLA